MKKKLALIGFLLLAAIFLFIDFDKLFSVLVGVNPFFVLIAFFMAVPTILFRSSKWFLMLREQQHKFSFFKIFKLYWIGIGLGAFTPGRLGDLAKAFFINKKVNSLSVSFSSVLVDRVVDLSVLVFLGIVSSLVFIYFFGITIVSLPLIALLLFALLFGFYLLFNKPLLKSVLKPFYRFLIPERFKEKLSEGFDSFLENVQGLLKHPFILLSSFSLSLVSWFFNTLIFYFIAMSLGLNLSPVFLFLAMSLSVLISLLPVSVSGIGTREGLLILLFSLQALSPEQAVAFSFMVLFVSTVVAFFGIVLIATERIDLKKILSEE